MKASAILGGKKLAVTEAQMQKLAELEFFGEAGERDEGAAYAVEDGVAVLPVRGMVSHGLTAGERWWLDAFDTNDLADALADAAADESVRAIVLDVNSPGGMVVGTPELAAAVKAANAAKPVVAHTSSLMASAAYWFAAGAEKILATASAEVGSVGCYAIHLDLSAAQAMAGVRPVVFRSGDKKAAGVMGTKLSPGQAADIQAGVDAVGAEFREAVKAARPNVDADALDGRVFTGTEAAVLGLTDGISDLAGAVRTAREAADERERQNMEAMQDIARLQGELEAANGLLAEAGEKQKELAAKLEAANAELAAAKAEAENARAEAAKAEEAKAKAEADAAEKAALLAAAPDALKPAGTDPVAGLVGAEGHDAPADWASAVRECGYVTARKRFPELYAKTFGT